MAAAALVGLACSALFSAVLRLERNAFIAAYAGVAVPFLAGFALVQGIRPGVQLRRRWRAGVVGGVLAGALLIRNVVTQPASPPPAGLMLLRDLGWQGVVYGTVDALLLNLLPVLAAYGMQPTTRLASSSGRLREGALALGGSLVVAALYHLGFPEYRGPALLAPLIGNTVLVMAYLLTGNPLAPIIGHVLMHAAAVVHGAASTTQLPPHY